MKEKVLFICTHNSARSQMAEGLLRHLLGQRYEVFSAGTEETRVHPMARRTMLNAGIDISSHRSKSIEEFRNREFDVVVTVCDSAREKCPFFPGKVIIHKSFPDPSAVQGSNAEKAEAFRKVFLQIKQWLMKEFYSEVQTTRER